MSLAERIPASLWSRSLSAFSYSLIFSLNYNCWFASLFSIDPLYFIKFGFCVRKKKQNTSKEETQEKQSKKKETRKKRKTKMKEKAKRKTERK